MMILGGAACRPQKFQSSPPKIQSVSDLKNRRTSDAAKHRDAVAELMTPAQIVAAQKLAREWMRKSERP